MRTLCVILARAGSKGLPRKNELTLAGRPLLAWTIEHAQGSACLDHIVVSTDGDRLAGIARERGIEVVMRPADLANDGATVDSAARHAVAHVEHTRGVTFDAVVILYGNVPLRPADLTDRAVAMLHETGCDSVQSVFPVGKVHPYWMRTVDDADRLGKYQPNEVYRRQDLPPVYMLDGGIIAVTPRSLKSVVDGKPHAFLGEDQRAIVTEPGAVIDVDSALDLRIAEAIVAARAAESAGASLRYLPRSA